MADTAPHRYMPLDMLKTTWQERQLTAIQVIEQALYDKGYRRGQTYTPRGSLHPVAAFTAFIKAEHLLILMEHTDGGCELLRPVCETNDLAQTIAAIP